MTTEYIPFVHWDTHENGHATVERMKSEIDRPIAQLILDLEERGLLDRTLVVLASEFSRDMMIEGVPGSTAKDQSRAKTDVLKELIHYGLHRHFTGASSVLMFGGGMKRGFLYGETAAERPCLVTKNPVSLTDLHATILHRMGISPKTAFDVEKRPFYVTEGRQGAAGDGRDRVNLVVNCAAWRIDYNAPTLTIVGICCIEVPICFRRDKLLVSSLSICGDRVCVRW